MNSPPLCLLQPLGTIRADQVGDVESVREIVVIRDHSAKPQRFAAIEAAGRGESTRLHEEGHEEEKL
jgi:hypothetical protein